MHLLHVDEYRELSLTDNLSDNSLPPYGILSHTWCPDDNEVNFEELMRGPRKSKIGYKKLRFCTEQAARDGLQFVWVDSCCLDRSNSTDLGEAINSMFRWYRSAVKCYVYLTDVSTDGQSWEQTFQRSRWFTRGWTLQELIAPSCVEFYSVEGTLLGDKRSLELQIHKVTGIAVEVLRGTKSMSDFSVLERMSWAESRQTTREEDKAYSLLGLFDIHMPLIYGEGVHNAMCRLRGKIKKRSMKRQLDEGSAVLESDHCRSDKRFCNECGITSKTTSKLSTLSFKPIKASPNSMPRAHRTNRCTNDPRLFEGSDLAANDHNINSSNVMLPHQLPSSSRGTPVAITQFRAQPPDRGYVLEVQFPSEHVNEDDLRTLILFLMFFVRGFRLVSLAYIAIAGWAPLRSVSKMLPDNILLYDALGRSHNLPFSDYSDWSILSARLETTFRDCPGFQKVLSGQFILTDISEPEQDVGQWNWSSCISRSRRFKMSIVMRQLKMKDGMCSNCHVAVRNVSESTFACPSCGLFYRSSSHSRKRFSLDQLRSSQNPYLRSSSLDVPAIPIHEAPFWILHYDALRHAKKLFEDLFWGSNNRAEIRHDYQHRIEPKDVRSQNSETIDPRSLVAPVISELTKSSDSIAEDTEQPVDQEIPNQEEEVSIQSELSIDNSELATEEEEIQIFKGISIRQATPLYDAILSRALPWVQALLAQGVQADQHAGYWGTPLTAAVFIQFDEGAKLLLRAGANPLSLAGPLNGPLQTAACFGTLSSYIDILTHGLKHLAKRPRDGKVFQRAVDKALNSLVDAGFVRESFTDCEVSERVYYLLYAGANPFQRIFDDRTAFSIAVARRNSDLSVQFLAEAWSRKLLSTSDVIAMRSVLVHGTTELEKLPIWTRSCCQNLQMNRTENVEARVLKSLKGRLFSASWIEGMRRLPFRAKMTPPGASWSPSTSRQFNGKPIPHIAIS